MFAFLAPLLALPKWAYWLAGGVALVIAAGLWLHFHDKGVVEADRNAGNAKATAVARKADEGAQQASESKKDAVEQGNKDAEEAARQSDDPLADGLRKLRAKPSH